MLGLSLLAACGTRTADHQHGHEALPGFEDYTGPEDGIWPPQPVGVTGLRAFRSARLGTAMSDLAAARALGSALADARVKAALGARYLHIQTDHLEAKNGAAETNVVFFSYSHNETVEVILGAGGLELRRFAAAAYQPPEAQTEAAQAVLLARAALLESGFDGVAALEGWAMLAFQGRQAGGGFYGSRVLYVTFTAGEDTLPAYYAYVDLSARQVLEYGPIEGS